MAEKRRWSARACLLGVSLAALFMVLAGTASAAPILAFETPTSPTNGTPTLSGTSTDETDPVTVSISEGASVVRTFEITQVAGGTWSVTVPAPESLPSGSYTATAEQSEVGEAGTAGPVSFEVDTDPPS